MEDETRRPRGTKNLGQTCYLNATLQCLSCVSGLRSALESRSLDRSDPFRRASETVSNKDASEGDGSPIVSISKDAKIEKEVGGRSSGSGSSSSCGGSIVSSAEKDATNGKSFALETAFLEALRCTREEDSKDPGPLLRELAKRAPMFQRGRQQDAHELLRVLLEALMEEDSRSIKESESCTEHEKESVDVSDRRDETVCIEKGEKSRQKVAETHDKTGKKRETEEERSPTWVEEFFGMNVQSSVVCLQCGGSKNLEEIYLDISLELPEATLKKKRGILRKSWSKWTKGWRTTSKSSQGTEGFNRQDTKEKKEQEQEEKEEKMQVKEMQKANSKAKKGRSWFATKEPSDPLQEDGGAKDVEASAAAVGNNQSGCCIDGSRKLENSEDSVLSSIERLELQDEVREQNSSVQPKDNCNSSAPPKASKNAVLLTDCLSNFTKVEVLGTDCKVCCDTCTKNSIEGRLQQASNEKDQSLCDPQVAKNTVSPVPRERVRLNHSRSLSWADISGKCLIETIHEVPGSHDHRRTDLWRAACGQDKFFKHFSAPRQEKGETPRFALSAILKGCRLEVCLKPGGNGTPLEWKMLNNKVCHRFMVDVGFIDRHVEEDVLRLSFFAEIIFDCFSSLFLSNGIDHLRAWAAGGLKMAVCEASDSIELPGYNSSGEESCSSSESECAMWQLCGKLPNSDKKWCFPMDFNEVNREEHEDTNSQSYIPSRELKSVMRDSTRQLTISKCPRVLTLHIKRFQQRGRTFSKYSTNICFPRELDISPYCCDIACSASASYRLVAVVEHLGKTLQFGHYVAHVSVGKSWYYVSDDFVKEESLEEVLKSNAYILFYEAA